MRGAGHGEHRFNPMPRTPARSTFECRFLQTAGALQSKAILSRLASLYDSSKHAHHDAISQRNINAAESRCGCMPALIRPANRKPHGINALLMPRPPLIMNDSYTSGRPAPLQTPPQSTSRAHPKRKRYTTRAAQLVFRNTPSDSVDCYLLRSGILRPLPSSSTQTRQLCIEFCVRRVTNRSVKKRNSTRRAS